MSYSTRHDSRNSLHPSAPSRAAGLVSATLIGFFVLALPSRGEAQSSPASSTMPVSAQIIDPSAVVGSRSVASVGSSAGSATAGLSVIGAGYRVQMRSGADGPPIVLLRGDGSSTIAWNSLARALERAGLSKDAGTASQKVLEVVLEVLD
jgi:hypothetical protein